MRAAPRLSKPKQRHYNGRVFLGVPPSGIDDFGVRQDAEFWPRTFPSAQEFAEHDGMACWTFGLFLPQLAPLQSQGNDRQSRGWLLRNSYDASKLKMFLAFGATLDLH